MRPKQDLMREVVARLGAVLEAEGQGFAALLRLAELDPHHALRRRDLRGARFGGDDVGGWDFSGSDLTGATHDHGFAGAIIDDDTIMPQGWTPTLPFDLREVHRLILAGKEVPKAWRKLVVELNFGRGSEYIDEAAQPGFDAAENRANPRILRDLTPIAGLTALQRLYLNGTGVSDLTPIAGLTALQRLTLNGTGVRDLTPIAGLTALQFLDLNGTQVRDASMLRHRIGDLRLPEGAKRPGWDRGE